MVTLILASSIFVHFQFGDSFRVSLAAIAIVVIFGVLAKDGSK